MIRVIQIVRCAVSVVAVLGTLVACGGNPVGPGNQDTLRLERGGFAALFESGGVSFATPGDGDAQPVRYIRYRPTVLSGDSGEIRIGAGRASRSKDTVKIDHGPVISEYQNASGGIEQRFVVIEDVGGDFVLHGLLEGAQVVALIDGELSIRHEGEEILHATAPRAFDADGRELDASFSIESGGLDIQVQGARSYPVLIDPIWTSSGDDQSYGYFGRSVSSAGDVNADGYDDIIVSAYKSPKVFLYLGSANGPATEPAWTAGGDEKVNSSFILDIASAGDVNGDGYADVIVSGYTNEMLNPVAGTYAGTVYLFLGGVDGLSTEHVWSHSGDGQADANYGNSIASAGDVNADGYDDIVVGAYVYDSIEGEYMNGGKAYLYMGSPDGPAAEPAWTSSGDDRMFARYGRAVTSAGDVNGDGFADVVISAHGQNTTTCGTGKAFLYLGSAQGLSLEPAWTSSGDSIYAAMFGFSASSAGDVNGDGLDDVIIGSVTPDSSGKVFLFLGSPDGLQAEYSWTSTGDDQAEMNFGFSISSAGDLNGDGYADVIIGSFPWNHPDEPPGKSFVFLGSPAGLSPSPAWTSCGDCQPKAYFGRSVSSAGDVNADGYTDVIVAAHHHVTSNYLAGKAYVYLGANAPSGLCDPAGAPCDDGDPDTINDACTPAGLCQGVTNHCNDRNPCTQDLIHPCTGECIHAPAPDGTPCDDQSLCTRTDTCQSGVCQGSDPIDCTSQNPCRYDGICLPLAGMCAMQAKPDETPCDDGNPCTQNDTCQMGVCAGSIPQDPPAEEGHAECQDPESCPSLEPEPEPESEPESEEATQDETENDHENDRSEDPSEDTTCSQQDCDDEDCDRDCPKDGCTTTVQITTDCDECSGCGCGSSSGTPAEAGSLLGLSAVIFFVRKRRAARA